MIGNLTTKRNELNPADYSCLGFYYVGPNEELRGEFNHYQEVVAGLEALSAAGKSPGCCDHCGTMHYYGVVYNGPEGVIAVGNQCAKNFFQFDSRLDYTTSRATRLIEERARRAAWAAENLERAAAFIMDNDGLSDMLAIDHPIIIDMAAKLEKYGSLSSRQIDFIAKLVVEVHTPKAEEVVPTEPLAEGRYDIEGEILSTKLQDSQYGSTWKMLVKMADGNKVWGSIPSRADWDKGDTVKFKGTVERSKDDQHFGFFKRPTMIKGS